MLTECLGCSPAVTWIDIFQNSLTKFMNNSFCKRFTLCFCLSRRRTHRNRSCNSVSNSDILDRLLILREFYIDRTSCCCDIHCITHCVFNVMSVVAFVCFLRNDDRCLNLCRFQINDSCFNIEVMDRDSANSVRSCDLNNCIPCMKC